MQILYGFCIDKKSRPGTKRVKISYVFDWRYLGRRDDRFWVICRRYSLYQTICSIECPSSIFFLAGGVFCYCSFLFVVSVSFRHVLFCSRWSFVDVPLIFFCPADHVPDWQPRKLLGMVEARSVNVKKTTFITIDCLLAQYV